MSPDGSENLLPDKTPKNLEKTISLESCNNEEVPICCDCDNLGYGTGDALFASFIVAPLVVSVWRGTWGIMDDHSDLFPRAQTFILGIIVHVCFALVRSDSEYEIVSEEEREKVDKTKKKTSKKSTSLSSSSVGKRKTSSTNLARQMLLSRSAGAWSDPKGGAGRWLRERFLSRVYAYVFILACINHWRGGWGLLDASVRTILPDDKDPHRPVLIAALTITFYLSVAALRSSRNILAAPYFLVTDGKEATYIFTTRYQTSSRETVLYVLDCVFSVAVVGSLVVFVWRGSWALLDIFLYPDDLGKSSWTSMIIGYALVVLTFVLQAPVRWCAARLHGAPRLLLADVYHLVSFVATVNVWRGVWGLLDVYFFPDSPKLSNWCCHIVSLALLIVLNCSNSVLVRGVYIDAEEPAGECVVFPCHYLRLFFHKERIKKRHRRALSAAAAAANRKSEDANSSLPLQMPEEKV